MLELNEEQKAALDCPARIVVVPACPGSGKTRLFVACILAEIDKSRPPYSGVAALSFTNVAEREISQRMSGGVRYPHFVGTIDSFLFRYVIRPFGKSMIDLSKFRYPISGEDFELQAKSITLAGIPRPVALSRIKVVRTQDKKTKAYAHGVEITGTEKTAVLQEKKAAWMSGNATHEDLCAIAARLLEADAVRGAIIGRFPSLFIDEFQDTAGSRETAMLNLLSDARLARGFVVGDPDQCIMQFAGARSNLFEEVLQLSGAKKCPLTKTHRFNERIGCVSRHLSMEGGELECPNPVRAREHSTLLLSHSNRVRDSDFGKVTRAYTQFISRNELAYHDTGDARPAAVIAWKNNVVAAARGAFSGSPKFKCNWAEFLFEAACHFERGDVQEAYLRLERVMSSLFGFDGQSPTRAELEHVGITSRSWKKLVWDHLLGLRPCDGSETLENWLLRAKAALTLLAAKCGLPAMVAHRIKVMRSSLGACCSMPAASIVGVGNGSSASGQAFQFDTVHRVKGREFSSVCFIVPDVASNVTPLERAWLVEKGGEEARVAFVAVTRAVHGLVLALPALAVQKLQETEAGRQFVGSFDCFSDVEDYLRLPSN
jgi:DNA helicase-2/ATP-dependent DNA helicase PcrA